MLTTVFAKVLLGGVTVPPSFSPVVNNYVTWSPRLGGIVDEFIYDQDADNDKFLCYNERKQIFREEEMKIVRGKNAWINRIPHSVGCSSSLIEFMGGISSSLRHLVGFRSTNDIASISTRFPSRHYISRGHCSRCSEAYCKLSHLGIQCLDPSLSNVVSGIVTDLDFCLFFGG